MNFKRKKAEPAAPLDAAAQLARDELQWHAQRVVEERLRDQLMRAVLSPKLPVAQPEPEPPVVKDVVGWRIWQVTGGFLASPHRAEMLVTAELEPATCKNGCVEVPSPTKCSNMGFGCGYYAMYERSVVENELRYRADRAACVMAKVSAVGLTEMHRSGFRSAQLRIDELWVAHGCESAERLDERYGTPVFEIEGSDQWKSESESSASSLNRLLQQGASPPQSFAPSPPMPLPGGLPQSVLGLSQSGYARTQQRHDLIRQMMQAGLTGRQIEAELRYAGLL